MPKQMRFKYLKWGGSSRAMEPPHMLLHVPQSTPQQALPSTTFEAIFRTIEEWARYERSFTRSKIWEICMIKIADFVEAKFKYLATFEWFEVYAILDHSTLGP